MPLNAAGLRFPHDRVLLARTKLAYVHLRNLLTDAKRDRAARVFGYVAIWLPEELVVLYMQEGELATATAYDGRSFHAVPLAEALARVPAEPELGEICFHEADDELLACMYAAQTLPAEAWPDELEAADPQVLFPYLASITFDGMVEIVADDSVNYLTFRDGAVRRSFLAERSTERLSDRVRRLFAADGGQGPPRVRAWPVPPPLPTQAAPALIQAYRDLAQTLVRTLVEHGSEGAPAVAEHARLSLADRHPELETFSIGGRAARDPVSDSTHVTAAVAAWVAEILWATAGEDTLAPEQLLRDLTHERRHMLQSAGFYDRLPWAVEW